MSIDDMSLEHMGNWFECMRDRKGPHATVDDGFAHSVACIMAAQSYWSGRRLYWDPVREEIMDRPPAPIAAAGVSPGAGPAHGLAG